MPFDSYSFLRVAARAALVEPSIPGSRLPAIARELDRHADAALKHGRVLLAEKASSRAAELRELAEVAR